MGTRGRKPKPTALKELAGNPGKRALNEAEPQPAAADVRVPRGRLPKDARALWRILAPQLDELGVLKATDLAALEMLCLHYALVHQARRVIAKDGLTVFGGSGGEKAHPATSILRANSALFKAYLTEFGLTPSSRVRIKAEPTKRSKTLAELLFEGVEPEASDG